MEQAINKAIEAGWKPTGNQFEGEIPVMVTQQWIRAFCWPDPLFWQALGKAMGKEDKTCRGCSLLRNDADIKKWNFCYCTDPDVNMPDKQFWMDTWLFQLHRFIDHLAEGGEPNDFFKNFLEEASVKPPTEEEIN